MEVHLSGACTALFISWMGLTGCDTNGARVLLRRTL